MRAYVTNNEGDWSVYRSLRNNYNRRIQRSQEADMKETIRRHKNDPKKLWNAIKKMSNNDHV